MSVRRDNPVILPACDCEGDEPCRVHGVLERERTRRIVLRAIKAGKITREQYEEWRARHFPKKKSKWNDKVT